MKIDDVIERAQEILGPFKGGSIVYVSNKNNTEWGGTSVAVEKFRQLVRTLKQTWVADHYVRDFTNNGPMTYDTQNDDDQSSSSAALHGG